MPDGAAPSVELAAPTYRAFISYSHRDKPLAMRLHRELEAFRVPSKLVGSVTPVGKVPRRLHPIFRDVDELPASGDLGTELMSALRRSMFLIVICSPASAKSQWVNEEILRFKRMHGEGRVLALVVDGIPWASDRDPDSPDECFPRSLRYRLGDDGELSDARSEPLAADLRPTADGRRLAKLKLVAGLTGLRLDDIVQREAQRRTQQLATITAASIVGMVFAGGLAFYAVLQRNAAVREERAAKAASDFLIGAFEDANPLKKNPQKITMVELLGTVGQKARTDLAGQPQIQAKISAMVGRSFNNLGLYANAREALGRSVPQMEAAGPDDGADPILVLATTYLSLSDFQDATNLVQRAERMLGPDLSQHTALRAEAWGTRGKILTAEGKEKEGIAAYDRALAFYQATPDPPQKDVARVLNNRGLLLADLGKFDAAEQSLRQSLDIYLRIVGENNLWTGQTWYALAYNSEQAHEMTGAKNLSIAAEEISKALVIERHVLGSDNPIIANALQLQGQIYQGLHKLPEAESSLQEAIDIFRKAYGKPHYNIGIAEEYLGDIQSLRGDTAGALATFDDAKHNYDVSYGKLHPNHGDLLVYRARVLARAGRMPEASTACAQGIGILDQTLGAQDSFTKSDAKLCAALTAPHHASGH
jgi:tetratricopeptide (TPR) repeat protein